MIEDDVNIKNFFLSYSPLLFSLPFSFSLYPSLILIFS